MLHIEQKILTAVGCVKQIHPTAIMDKSSLKKLTPLGKSIKVIQKETVKHFCGKKNPTNWVKVEKCCSFAQIFFGVKNALMENISWCICLKFIMLLHQSKLSPLSAAFSENLVFCISHNIKPKLQNPSEQEVKPLRKKRCRTKQTAERF